MAIPLNLPQRSSIVGLWHLDEESGTRADESGNGNTLQDNNSVLYGTGKIGNAADLESGTSEFFSITDALQTGLDLTTDFTFVAWVDIETGSRNGYIFAKYRTADNERAYVFGIDTNNKVMATLSSNGTAVTTYTSTNAVSTTGLQHIACVFDRDAGADNLRFYLNGVANGTATRAFDTHNSASDFRIGAYTSGAYFDGLIDEGIIWNTPLITAEVLAVKNISAYSYGNPEFLLNMMR